MLVATVLELTDLLRVSAERYGVAYLPDAAIAALEAKRRIVLAGPDDPPPSFIRPYTLTLPVNGVQKLHIRPDITERTNPSAFKFIRVRALLEVASVGVGATDEHLDTAAALAVLPVTACRRQQVAWIRARINQLETVTGLWERTPLRQVLLNVNTLLPRFADRERPRAEVLDAAKAHLAAARAARDSEPPRYIDASREYQGVVERARDAADWELMCTGQLGLARVYKERGVYPLTHQTLDAALRVADRHGLDKLRGHVHHDRFVLAHEVGRDREAFDEVERAVCAYGDAHPRLPALAHDYAYFLITRGVTGPAVPVCREVVRLVAGTAEEVCAWATLARAAGAERQRNLLATAIRNVEASVARHPTFPILAEVWLDCARGAQSAGKRALAERLATRALRTAVFRRQRRVEFEADAVLASTRAERATAAQAVRPEAAVETRAQTISAEIVQTLRKRSPAAA